MSKDKNACEFWDGYREEISLDACEEGLGSKDNSRCEKRVGGALYSLKARMKILLIYKSVESQKDGAIVEPLALFQQNLTREQRKNRELPYQK